MDDKKVKVRVNYDFKALKYIRLCFIKFHSRTRMILIYGIMIVVLLGLSTYYVIDQLGKEEQSYILPIIIFFMLIYIVYQILTIESKVERDLEKHFAYNKVIVYDMDINSERLLINRIDNINSEEQIPEPILIEWIQIQKIYEVPEYYFLLINRASLIIPKNTEAILEGTNEDLAEIIKEQASRKPYQFINKDIAKRKVTYVHNYFNEVERASEATVVEGEDHSDNETLAENAEVLFRAKALEEEVVVEVAEDALEGESNSKNKTSSKVTKTENTEIENKE